MFLIGRPGHGDRSGADIGATIRSGPSGRGGENPTNTNVISCDQVRLTFDLSVWTPLQVFKKAYIPRTLTDVSHYERDVDLMRTKEEESSISGHDDNVRKIWDVNVLFFCSGGSGWTGGSLLI